MSFAVAFQGVAVPPVFDPFAGFPPLEIRRQFAVESCWYLAVQADLTEKLHPVWTGEAEQAVLQKTRRKPLQRARLKHDIGGPFAWGNGPVVVRVELREEFL